MLTVGAYSLIFSWEFAVALVLMIGVHECGHVYAMWRCGLKVKGIYFIPFVGGVAVSKGMAKTRWNNAYIALAGPVWGAALAVACAAAYRLTGERWPFLGAMAAWGALINLFNLLPILPLDGGRVLASVAYSSSRGIGAVATFGSLVLGGTLAYLAQLELLVLMVILGLFEYGGHLAALPMRPALALIGDRPLGPQEHEQFARLVSAPTASADKQAERRRARFVVQRQEAGQDPMTVGQSALVLVGALALAGILVAIIWMLDSIPGAGTPLEFLQ